MARTSNINFGQVAAIADAMKAAGNRPTARAVRERIGSGSMGTIHKFLQQWQGKATGQDDDEDDGRELPSSIQKALLDFIGCEVATACEPLAEELQTARDDLDAIAQENERLTHSIKELERLLEQCGQERAAAMAQLNMTRDELRNANKAREDIGEKYTALLRDLDRSQRQVEMLASLQPDLIKAQTELATVTAQRTALEIAAASTDAQLRAEQLRANDLAERLEKAERRNANQESELRTAQQTAQRASAELSAVARELADAKAATQPAKAVKSTAKKPPVKKPANQELAV